MAKVEETMANIFDCPKCNKEINADNADSQIQRKICYRCLNCGHEIYKRIALRLMEKKDGLKRWSICNYIEDKIDPFTGEKLIEKDVGNGWVQLVRRCLWQK